jgi:hypothetical protein
VQTDVWTGDDDQPPAQTEHDLYRACRNIGSPGCGSGSVLTSLSTAAAVKCEPQATSPSAVGSAVTSASNAGPEGKPAAAVVECKPKKECGARKEDFYWPEDFVLGDVVWARSGKKCPAWPALVIDPLLHAPEVVLNSCVPGALCVMFFGYSASGHSRVIMDSNLLIELSVYFPCLNCCFLVKPYSFLSVFHVLPQDYGWVKQGMLFPFVEYLDR